MIVRGARSDREAPRPLGLSAPTWHSLSVHEVCDLLASGERGLDPGDARGRLESHGPNRLEEAPAPSAVELILHQFRSPLIYILLIAAGVTLVVGEYVDAGVIAAVLVLNAVIGFVQEGRAEASVRALMGLVVPRARVLRDGREWEIDSSDLTPGDLVLLESGARVPADLRLSSTTSLAIDESLLTGESLPLSKQVAPLDEGLPLADRRNMAYMGSVVTTGRGRGYVVATGSETELGSIAGSVREAKLAITPLQARMGRFARVVAIAAGLSAGLAFAIGIAVGESPSDMFMVGVALAVSAVPEGLPVVFTITLAIGVRRMARRNAIVRRLPAVETLGSTTTIGSDKTGTLTENRMEVQEVWTTPVAFEAGDAGGLDLAEHPALGLTLLAGVLASEAEIYLSEEGVETHGDPTEVALLIAASKFGIEPERVRQMYETVAELPFEPELRYSASMRNRGRERFIFVKGAPERVLEMCDAMQADGGRADLQPDAVHSAARDMARRGLRVLGMAYAPLDDGEVALDDPQGLTFLGLQGMMDPPRRGVREAIEGCRQAGMRVIMITGDHALTARSIAARLGIAAEDSPVATGVDLDGLDDDALGDEVAAVSVFARVSPDHKLRIVRALQAKGEVVAVTGDGVNDAPALKSSDIGIAMGRSGTDVAREASDMVLADDNFVTIYAAVEEGRVTFGNLRKVTFFLISSGAAEVLAILAALIAGWPLLLLPAQILWLNLVTNGLHDVALAFEPGEKDVLDRPPRSKSEGVVSRLLWERTLIAGIVMAAGTLYMFRWELDHGGSHARAQAVALTTMVLFQAFHAGNARSDTKSLFGMSPFSNRYLMAAVAGTLLLHASALYMPWAQSILRVEPLDLDAWLRMTVVASSILVAVEAHKALRRRTPMRASR